MSEVVNWPKDEKSKLCSVNVGSCGHEWEVKAVTVGCEGCGGVVVAVLKENCPVCNEPQARVKLRMEFLARGGTVHAECKGQVGDGVVIEREVR